MSRNSKLLILVVLVIVIHAACIPFGDAWVHFSGYVRDTDGKPIKGAQLKILFNGEVRGKNSETQSDAQGAYSFYENSCPCEFEFVTIAAKDGYKIFTKKMTATEANNLKNLEIVMERIDAATPPNNSLNPTPR